jgi:chromosome segregation ATPase
MPPDSRVTSKELDRVLRQMESNTNTLSKTIEKNTLATETIGKKIVLLEAKVNDAKEEIGKLDDLIRGDNIQSGLKTKTELMESNLTTLQKRISSIDNIAIVGKEQVSKRKTALSVAIISGSFAGLVAFAKIIVGFFL